MLKKNIYILKKTDTNALTHEKLFTLQTWGVGSNVRPVVGPTPFIMRTSLIGVKISSNLLCYLPSLYSN